MHPSDGARLRGERLKCIMGIADTEKPAFNIVLKAAIAHNNYKPFLSKTASFCYVGEGYFEIDVDIHTWGASALNAFNTLKGSLPQMLLRGGVVVEAESDAEMPENILAAVNMTHLNVKGAPRIDAGVAAYLNDPANHVPPLERLRRNGRAPRAQHVSGGDHSGEHSDPGGEHYHSDPGGHHSDPGTDGWDEPAASARTAMSNSSAPRGGVPDISDSL